MTTTPELGTLERAAVDALLAVLPLPGVTRAVIARDLSGSDAAAAAAAIASAVQASFVGARSADLAVAVLDGSALLGAAGGDSALVSAADVLRPSLEAAASTLGTGLLGASAQGDASGLIGDDEAVVFELLGGSSGEDTTIGWFAIRVREAAVLTPAAGSAASDADVLGRLGRINNVEMALTVELGRTRMTVRDVLSIEPGAVIELDRSAGAPADVLLNGRLIAHGEIVVVDQDYAVRITRILDVADGAL
ncbi:flagellar motor switch protein FliN [Microterricola pindariensis]|uniref:Flagellar motor switch protein FliN n=1 Tax=Microterricola pindariensis TaxID=478010 RepID=A0ABX5ASC8_9MICO|nr:flagellar motor switch protein FliN [Microterricola pindariensis]PPL15213.1 flagellar motor switch protein FliN [Microterricola pindariensis]